MMFVQTNMSSPGEDERSRGAFKDLSNVETPVLCRRAMASAETPVNTCWTSGTDFKFVEEGDDEVMFRVRDSGVLRSLALPVLGDATEKQAVVDCQQTLEQKQVLHLPLVLCLVETASCQAQVKAIRLSFLVENPPALPSLSEVKESTLPKFNPDHLDSKAGRGG